MLSEYTPQERSVMPEEKLEVDSYLKGERLESFHTLSGIPVKELYTPSDLEGFDYSRDLGSPGEYPFTRGVYRDMYRGRFWTRRAPTGYATPKLTNERIKYMIRQGSTALNLATDIASEFAIDPDHPLVEGEVGVQGASIFSLPDMEVALAGIALDKASLTQVTMPPAAPIRVAFLVALAEKQGFSPELLKGTIQCDPLFQVAGGPQQSPAHFYPLDLGTKLVVDVVEHCARYMPKVNTPVINQYNVRETGVGAIVETACGIAEGIWLIEETLKRGLEIDQFAPRISFFVSVQIDFFEEIAKLRAQRRLWARIVKERFGAKNPLSWRCRFAAQQAGSSLTSQQYLNNLARMTIEGMAGTLGGVQSVMPTSPDEGLGLPTEDSQTLALRCQQIIAYESGITATVDPLAGSYYVESLTNTMEEEVEKMLGEIGGMGGIVEAVRSGWLDREIMKARVESADKIEKGERVIVGVNAFQSEDEPEVKIHRHLPEWEEERKEDLRKLKESRDNGKVQAALEKVAEKVKADENTIPAVVEAVKAHATQGEIADAMREAVGFEVI